jgi:hypothetical protein
VAVRVVRAQGDQRNPRARRRQEAGVGVPAAVVRHLQHVGGQVHAVLDEAGLRRGTEVAGQQDAQPVDRDADDEGQVVRLVAHSRTVGARREHRQLHPADAPPVAGGEQRSRSRGAPQHRVERGRSVVVGRERSGCDDPDLPPRQRTGESAHVVGVEVAQEHQRQLVDAETVQAAVDRADLRSGVDEHTGTGRGREDEGIPLPDVAGDQDRVLDRPAAGRLAQRPADQDHSDQRDQHQSADADRAPQDRHSHQQEHAERDGAHRSARPAHGGVGQPGRALGHQDQPAHRPSGHPHHEVGRRRAHRSEHRGTEAEHRGHRHGRCRQQVGRDGHQAHRAVQTGDERRRGQARGAADGEGIGHRCGPAPLTQPPGPARREQHDRRRRRDRQGEPRVVRQGRLEQEQHGRGRGERGDGRAWPARREGPQRDRAHGGSADDAGRRPGEDDEADESQQRHGRLHPAVDRATAQRPQHRSQHDRDVGAGHRRQVRQTGVAEVLLEDRIAPAAVADDQPGQQTGRGRWEHSGRRLAQRLPDPPGGRLPPVRRGDG